MTVPPLGQQRVAITSFDHGLFKTTDDTLAVERPLEMHIAGIAPIVTMRTPGHDEELVAGFLYGEGVIREAADLVYLERTSTDPDIMRVMLRPEARARLERAERSTLTTSACGVCGKARFRPPQKSGPTLVEELPRIRPEWLLSLPDQLRAAQGLFEATGGLHAAALFDPGGNLIELREDVGRHNALDKLIGRAVFDQRLPLSDKLVMLSGRAGYELLQKLIVAGVPVVGAISAPSSYAVELAAEFGVTLVGFIRGGRFNVYANAERIN